jgi:uncharacterized protein (DUF362 family)
MARLKVARVDGYDAHEPIRAFVDAVLDDAPAVTELLADDDPSRVVVIKPNWIQEAHEYRPEVWEPVITHPAVILATVEAVAERLRGRGTISLCDAPHTYADFPSIVRRGDLLARIEALRDRWPELTIELIDLRRETWKREEEVVVERRPNPDDPRGYARLNLGRDSLFFGHPGEGRYYGADYDSRVVNQHHQGATQEYLLAGTPLRCDLFINLPKLKTHKKTGVTCCLKNLVGINGDKNWLPHHIEGSPADGGDEFPSAGAAHGIERRIKRVGRQVALRVPGLGTWLYRKARNVGKQVLGDSDRVVRNGNWHGNDSCWRMALDLNRALLYGQPDGSWREAGQAKRYLAIVDGIVGGEGNGPLCPEPVASNVLLGGDDPAAVDALACRLMGFDPGSLPIVAHAFAEHRWPIATTTLDRLRVDDQRRGETLPLGEVAPAVSGGFRPHFGWTTLREAG